MMGQVEESGGDNDDSDNNTPSETPSGSDEKKLQCASSCTVEVGHTKSLSVTAYGSSLEELETLTQKFVWQSDDTNVADVKGIGFILPTSATKYSSETGIYETWLATGMVGVKGISEGSATITGTAADGSKVTCQVTVTEPEEIKNNIYRKTAIHRFATVDEVVDAYRFCIDNPFVNGSLIEINGGYSFR